uniref:NADH dehydrogenase [ubiquinone] iron-sulfur protein 4, mitochondrial n=1 Tax=Erythrolobus australicus TaxID=1077150 RepID=A0A7S1TN47_9RHOD|mmetsp:Transcript_3127/g.8719  ORF Transcript_3127/g.8719 Transcript_3127/m.8719 type:complete len:147 (+) Transcript_3127:359-799(+)
MSHIRNGRWRSRVCSQTSMLTPRTMLCDSCLDSCHYAVSAHRVSTQQGKGATSVLWRAEFEKIEGADRWTNPLMGWTSTADPLSNTSLSFASKEEAIEYATRYGYKYTVFEPEHSKENLRKFSAYGKSMVHQWRHKIPVFDSDSSK